MKTLRLISNIKKGLLGLLILSLWSCQDELWTSMMNGGEQATLNLQVDLSEMTPLTRADMSGELENRVNNLWVGVYNKATGQRTGTTYIDSAPGNYPEPTSGNVTLNALSGESYIVAVANCAGNQAITVDDSTPTNLKDLLDKADSWDAFCSIILSRNYNDNNTYAIIDVPTNSVENGLVMQGSYRSATEHQHSYRDDEPETVNIAAGTNNLTGKIHLRRLWTQNKVNFEATGNVISMEIIDMEVVNVPQYSWLQSRSQGEGAGTDNKLKYANAGDALSTEATADASAPYYLQSLKVTQSSMDITTSTGNNSKYSYDFWQYENKRTGHIAADAYALREKEVKEIIKEDDQTTENNQGIYTALCPDEKWTLDNNATYIRFKAMITYKDNSSGALTPPSGITDKDADFNNVKQRTAEATYVVHLGYIDKDANDFNCYRNAKYTYNIKIASVNKILVEAFREGEYQPGAEGDVNDVTDGFYDLDCHFNVFNIYLTRDNLKNFTFTMRTYDNNVAHDVKYLGPDNLGNVNIPTSRTDKNWKYYSWIQLVPNNNTSAAGTNIAPFPRLDENGKAGDDELYYLKDIAEKGESLLLNNRQNGKGFTVYVKEYTYEADYGEKEYGDETTDLWKGYVNQPNRTAHFNVSLTESTDKESVYYKSKYALTQKSIQTYYDVAKATGEGKESTALGIEHENEVFGMNIRWPNAVSSNNNANNGRWNVAEGLGLATKSGNNFILNEIKWNTVVDHNSLQQINAINNTTQTAKAYHLSLDKRTCPVPKTVQITSGLSGSGGHFNEGAAADFDPQHGDNAQYIDALKACMNRNKDENGNGIIDPEELKWYVPASGKYLRIILGRNSLKTPLMNYEQETLPAGSGDDANTLYHFVASDSKIIWVEEGASSSIFYGNTNKWSHAPWQVRCIRNLGTNLKTITDGERVIPAYDDTGKDNTTHGGVVKVNRYHGGALREPQTSPLPMHKSDESYNRIARYGFEIAPCGNAFDGTYGTEAAPQINGSNISRNTEYTAYANAVKNGTFCNSLNTSTGRNGWRVPNQKEIIIMMRMGILQGGGYFATCTQEHWTNYEYTIWPEPKATSGGKSDEELSWNYRVVSVDLGGPVASACNIWEKTLGSVRCVRDLTAAEANKSYAEITGPITRATRASKAKKHRR